jgi:uncharacterized membrane protein
MFTNKAIQGALLGALIAIIWVAFDGGAVLLVVGFATIGWLVGMALQHPDVLIGFLERLQDR